MIYIRDVSKSFGNFKALDNINIKINKGTVHGVIGENGAGKTTLLQMLAGIYVVEEGNILFNGNTIYENNSIKQKIGYVADRNQYFKDYKVNEMIDFYEGIYDNFSRESFELYNKKFKLDKNKKIRQLSKGMQMRLSLMLNLSIDPDLLILDEPTSGLDAIAKKDLLDILIKKVEEGMTVVISSHHISELEKICDEITIIEEGKIKYQSNIENIKDKVKKLQLVYKDDKTEELKRIKSIIHVENVGSVYYIVTDNYNDKLVKELKSLGTDVVENIGISLEEIFIYTNKKNRGDIDE